jgi:hypothetical protein
MSNPDKDDQTTDEWLRSLRGPTKKDLYDRMLITNEPTTDPEDDKE